ncbi:MAG TPA: GGDEF domain-containing protein [Bryobacteraceae bacterium]|nr:GGDEF domain-containing protein [Bryobacteraceae bacterium]
MDPSYPAPDTATFYIQEIGALLFGMAFLFVYRQSRIVYFGLWTIAWLMRFLAAIFGYELLRTLNAGWLAPHATFEFGFLIVLIAAARAGFAADMKDWRTVLRLIAILPMFVTLVYAVGTRWSIEAWQTSDAMVLGGVYFYNFRMLRQHQGIGSRFFRFSLLLLSVLFIEHAITFLYLYNRDDAAVWARYLHYEGYWDFVLHCVLAFSAMAMWSENSLDRIRGLMAELDRLRRERRHVAELDGLTGLLNQAALARRIEQPNEFGGVVAVCDMNNFKEINDRYGHLVGDEILRNIGSLLQSSIRPTDEAFRWGGDEFVILFHNQDAEVVRRRMGEIEARLRDFQVRGYGVLPISFSWGTADAQGRPMREALDEADRSMYSRKRKRGGTAGER